MSDGATDAARDAWIRAYGYWCAERAVDASAAGTRAGEAAAEAVNCARA